jgi:hypothetical protein
MSSPLNLPKLLADLPKPMKGQPRLVVICANWPERMTKPLRDALKYVFETHASSITGVVGGHILQRNKGDRYKGNAEVQRPSGVTEFHVTELEEYLIHGVLEAWAAEAGNFSPQQGDTVQHRLGPDMFFFEPNADFTKPLRVWRGYDMFPEDTGLFDARRPPACEPDSKAERKFKIRFPQELRYNQPSDIQNVITLMNLHREELNSEGTV